MFNNCINKHFDKLISCSLLDNSCGLAWAGFYKPNKKMFDYGLNLAEVLPSESIFIDDSLVNINAAIKHTIIQTIPTIKLDIRKVDTGALGN